ncbi:MAG: YceI family protein [Acidimicrobiaceae bacterium]|jgi:polyisoprenoid-binding protein YceI|nr:YceI family protein [Acidimicrobiaceae bacterium]
MITQANADLTSLVGMWRLNPERTSVSFRTRAAWLVRAKGTLHATEGTVDVDPDGRVTGEIVIDPASIDTKVEKRDDHLRSADFFDVANHPTITFTVTESRPAPSGNFEVVGNLAVLGRSMSVTLLAEVGIAGETATLSTEVVVTKRILGMKKATSTKSWVTVQAHFDRARP